MTANTPPDLEALEELLAKATRRPWDSRIEPQHYPECDDVDFPATVSGAGQHIAFLPERYDAGLVQVNDVDAALIVAAVNALPHLIAALRDAREALEPFARQIERCDEHDIGSDWLDTDHDLTVADIRRARATLRKLESTDDRA